MNGGMVLTFMCGLSLGLYIGAWLVVRKVKQVARENGGRIDV